MQLPLACENHPVDTDGGRGESSYSGYGYFNGTHGYREAEAARAFEFSCTADSVRNYVERGCNLAEPLEPTTAISELITEAMQSNLMQRMQEQALEYYAYQLYALNDNDSIELTRPSCIPESSPMWQKVRAVTVEETDTSPVEQQRVNSFRRMLDPVNVGKAYVYNQRLEHFIGENHCNESSHEDFNHVECPSLLYQQRRLHEQFPVLWSQWGLETPRYSSIATGFEKMMGMDENSDRLREFPNLATDRRQQREVDSLLRQAQNDGRSQIADAAQVGSNSSYLDYEQRLTRVFNENSVRSESTPARQAANRYTNGLEHAKEGLRNSLRASLNNICSYENLDTSRNRYLRSMGMSESRLRSSGIMSMALNRPTVLRQLLMDMSETDRSLAMAVLCNTGRMDFLRGEVNNCRGVSGGPLEDGNPVHVQREAMADWPFSSENNYTITDNPTTGRRELSMTINLVPGPNESCQDANGDGVQDCLAETQQRWQTDVNNWLNCETGAIPSAIIQSNADGGSPITRTCPRSAENVRNPLIEFKVNFVTHPRGSSVPEPKVTVHRCFHADVRGGVGNQSDCEDVDEYLRQQCMNDWTLTVPKTEASCQAEIERLRSIGSARVARANSANFVFGSKPGTIRHEVLHLFGLPDEYAGMGYVMSHAGESDSIMNQSKVDRARIFPRHFDMILAPLECSEGSAE